MGDTLEGCGCMIDVDELEEVGRIGERGEVQYTLKRDSTGGLFLYCGNRLILLDDNEDSLTMFSALQEAYKTSLRWWRPGR